MSSTIVNLSIITQSWFSQHITITMTPRLRVSMALDTASNLSRPLITKLNINSSNKRTIENSNSLQVILLVVMLNILMTITGMGSIMKTWLFMIWINQVIFRAHSFTCQLMKLPNRLTMLSPSKVATLRCFCLKKSQ